MAYTFYKDLTSVNREVRSSRTIKGLVMHYTGNKTDKAKNNAKFFRSVNRGASAHYFVDETTVYQVVEDKDVAWSVGRNYGSNNLFGVLTNENTISIEMCSTNGIISDATIANAVILVKQLMAKYNIPANMVVRHWDVCSKRCPGWTGWIPGDESKWNAFKSALVSTSPTSTVYRVRKTWADAKSQIGAFGSIENAKKACEKGYSVFDSNGNVVYTNGGTPTPAPIPAPTPQPKAKANIYYCVNSQGKRYSEVKNATDYAGVENRKVWNVAMRVDCGSIQYQVHVLGGGWLPYVSGYSWSDSNNGYAGVNKPIDGIRIKGSNLGGNIKYKVSYVGSTGYLPVVTNDSDYAGVFGRPIDKVMAWIE